MVYVLFFRAIKGGLHGNPLLDDLTYKVSGSFSITKNKFFVTVVKAPMAHKKWSKEQLGVKFFLYSSSITVYNFYNFFDPKTLYTLFLFISKNLFYLDNPAVMVRTISTSMNLKLKIRLL